MHKAVHLLSLVAHESGLTLAQAEVANGGAEKTNEHKAGLKLLERLALEGRVVTGDAMFCHRDVCETILDRGAITSCSSRRTNRRCSGTSKRPSTPPRKGAFPPSTTHMG